MMIVPDEAVEVALAVLADEEGAAARAAHEYLSDLSKSVLAELIGESNATSAIAKENWARAQPRFKEHLVKVGEFAKRDYIWRQRYSAASAKIECWRTQNANIRAAERLR
jgi:hypothetical protein